MGSGYSPGGAHPPGSEPSDPRVAHHPLVNWWDIPRRTRRQENKTNEIKKGGGGKEEKDSTFQS